MENGPVVLVFEDKSLTCHLNKEELALKGYILKYAANSEKVLELLESSSINAVLLCLKPSSKKNFDLIKRIKIGYPSIPVIVLTASNDPNTAVKAMKAGAADYITEPLTSDRIIKAFETEIKSPPADKSADKDFFEIEAIALGVEAREEILAVHSEKITQQTADIARAMGLSEETIQRWISSREQQQAQKLKYIADSICKLTSVR
jgi:DNA-binding NtrC family response regulator